MSDADPALLIERLRRANRRWNRLAALLAVALIGAGSVVAVQHDRAGALLRAADEASRAEQEAERQRAEVERARDEARRLLYVAHVQLATQEWERGRQGGDPKP